MAHQYLDSIQSLAPEAAHIIDKMPHNFEKLWLIALLVKINNGLGIFEKMRLKKEYFPYMHYRIHH